MVSNLWKEFKGTGNMELPVRSTLTSYFSLYGTSSSTRRDDILLSTYNLTNMGNVVYFRYESVEAMEFINTVVLNRKLEIMKSS
jgi:transcription termination factor Rho